MSNPIAADPSTGLSERPGRAGTALHRLRFDDAFVRELPGDPLSEPRPRQVHGALYSPVEPTRVARPHLIAHSREVAAMLGFSEADVASAKFAEVFGGNALLPGMQPYAAIYGGHQFGQWPRALSPPAPMPIGGESSRSSAEADWRRVVALVREADWRRAVAKSRHRRVGDRCRSSSPASRYRPSNRRSATRTTCPSRDPGASAECPEARRGPWSGSRPPRRFRCPRTPAWIPPRATFVPPGR